MASVGQELCECGQVLASDQYAQANLSKNSFELSPEHVHRRDEAQGLPAHFFPLAEAERVDILKLFHGPIGGRGNAALRATEDIYAVKTVAAFG